MQEAVAKINVDASSLVGVGGYELTVYRVRLCLGINTSRKPEIRYRQLFGILYQACRAFSSRDKASR